MRHFLTTTTFLLALAACGTDDSMLEPTAKKPKIHPASKPLLMELMPELRQSKTYPLRMSKMQMSLIGTTTQ